MVQRGGVAVVTDSSASLPPTLVERFGVAVVPVRVMVDGGVRHEDEGFTAAQALRELASGAEVSSAAPSPEAFAEAYEGCARAGAAAVLSLHVARSFSDTCRAAEAAAEDAAVPVTVLDTGAISMAQGFAVLAAAATALQGAGVAQAAQAAHDVLRSGFFAFTVEGLEHLRRGGRVSALVEMLGGLLAIRPVVTVLDGQPRVVERVRHTGPARQRVRSLAQEAALDMRRPAGAVSLVGGDAMEEGLGMVLDGPVFEAVPGASLAVNTGPGTYAAAVADMPDAFFRRLSGGLGSFLPPR